jgi:S-(hydroxymethyl)glutathione dehydrogenase/alcohol dehydrogenase
MTPLPLTFFTSHCKTVVGVLYGMIHTHQDIPTFADMAMRGDLMLDRLITKTFKVEEINQVAEAMKNRQIVGRWVCDWGKGK